MDGDRSENDIKKVSGRKFMWHLGGKERQRKDLKLKGKLKGVRLNLAPQSPPWVYREEKREEFFLFCLALFVFINF